jgi:hypothetical protein
MTDLLLRQVAESRAGAEGQDDFDVIGPDGLVIGRIFKAATSPPGTPWMWTIAYGDREPAHGYEATREGAMQAFARSWHRESPSIPALKSNSFIARTSRVRTEAVRLSGRGWRPTSFVLARRGALSAL